jgi:hypothetical protein
MHDRESSLAIRAACDDQPVWSNSMARSSARDVALEVAPLLMSTIRRVYVGLHALALAEPLRFEFWAERERLVCHWRREDRCIR